VTGAGPDTVQEAAEALRARGFINYFGLQRFGSGSSGTHRRGRCTGRSRLALVCCHRTAMGQVMYASCPEEPTTRWLAR